jgi:snRNA-activating protein complex subunit 3
MEETQWIDLNVQLGYPYLYNHVGNCEHLVIFQNIK